MIKGTLELESLIQKIYLIMQTIVNRQVLWGATTNLKHEPKMNMKDQKNTDKG